MHCLVLKHQTLHHRPEGRCLSVCTDKNENLNYLLDNIYLILSYACLNDKIDLFKLITKFINFKYLPSDQLELIIYWLLVLSDKSIKIFDYLFLNLKLPENLKFEDVGKITYFLISTGNINLLDKFLKDDRVSFQKHFKKMICFLILSIKI